MSLGCPSVLPLLPIFAFLNKWKQNARQFFSCLDFPILGSHWRLGCVIIFTISIFRHGLAYVSRWLITQLEKRSKMFNNKWQNTPKKGMPCKHQWAFYKPVDINHRHGTHPGHYRLAMLAFWKLSTPSKLCQFRNCGNFAYCLENSLIDTCRLERSYYETDINWKLELGIVGQWKCLSFSELRLKLCWDVHDHICKFGIAKKGVFCVWNNKIPFEQLDSLVFENMLNKKPTLRYRRGSLISALDEYF